MSPTSPAKPPCWCVILLCVVFVAHGLPLRVLPLGDSLSSCTGLNAKMTKGVLSFRYWLWQNATKDNLSRCMHFVGTLSGCNKRFDEVFPGAKSFPPQHDAFFGRTSLNVLEKLDAIINRTDPTVAMVLLGINDMMLLDHTPKEVISRLTAIVERLRTSNAAVFLATIPPIYVAKMKGKVPRAEKVMKSIPRLNGLIKELHQSFPTDVYLVDAAAGFDASRLTYDGVHPTKEGARQIASCFYQKMKPFLEGHCSMASPMVMEPAATVQKTHQAAIQLHVELPTSDETPAPPLRDAPSQLASTHTSNTMPLDVALIVAVSLLFLCRWLLRRICRF